MQLGNGKTKETEVRLYRHCAYNVFAVDAYCCVSCSQFLKGLRVQTTRLCDRRNLGKHDTMYH